MRLVRRLRVLLVIPVCILCFVTFHQHPHLSLRHSSLSALAANTSWHQYLYLRPTRSPLSALPANTSLHFARPRPNIGGKEGVKGGGLPLLTLFSTWKDPAHLSLVRNLTLRNWAQLGPQVIPLLFTNDTGTAAQARRYGWHILPVSKTAIEVPVLKYMYLDAMNSFNSKLYAYANGDLLFTDGLVESLVAILGEASLNVSQKSSLFAVGRRTNVLNVTEQEALNLHNVSAVGRARGKIFMSYAQDFFITGRRFPWDKMPEVVIGRVAYDNWLLMYAIRHGHVVIDVTETVPAIHQTTKVGNFEGRTHPNPNYNALLLRQLYSVKDYSAGGVDCAPWQTLRSSEGRVVVKKRKSINKDC